ASGPEMMSEQINECPEQYQSQDSGEQTRADRDSIGALGLPCPVLEHATFFRLHRTHELADGVHLRLALLREDERLGLRRVLPPKVDALLQQRQFVGDQLAQMSEVRLLTFVVASQVFQARDPL